MKTLLATILLTLASIVFASSSCEIIIAFFDQHTNYTHTLVESGFTIDSPTWAGLLDRFTREYEHEITRFAELPPGPVTIDAFDFWVPGGYALLYYKDQQGDILRIVYLSFDQEWYCVVDATRGLILAPMNYG